MKVWLDDCRDKPWHFTVWVTNYQDCVYIVDTNRVDEISLDHDLGHGPTGYDVARHIEALAWEGKVFRMKWHVHSANPVGAERIRMAMGKADEYWASWERGGYHYRG